jgi:hypothetical protein
MIDLCCGCAASPKGDELGVFGGDVFGIPADTRSTGREGDTADDADEEEDAEEELEGDNGGANAGPPKGEENEATGTTDAGGTGAAAAAGGGVATRGAVNAALESALG